MIHRLQKAIALVAAAAMTLLAASPAFAQKDDSITRTPIQHVVVIFQENLSFDHYFGTYPNAKPNKDGSVYFKSAKKDTPRVNNLMSSGLLDHNPNAANPFRLDRSEAVTCDQDHDYGDEQKAFHGGLMDKFIEELGCNDSKIGKNTVMGYYDGNVVTAFWNYAQHFAMSDNSYSTTFGPSTPGAINLIAGNTFRATITRGPAAGNIAGGLNSGAVIGDPRPDGDVCVPPSKPTITVQGKNVGDLLNAQNVTWGWFQGGFADCNASHTGLPGFAFKDYIPHHEPFQYFPRTANPKHLPPSSVSMIGKTDQANHQYDMTDFWRAVDASNMPAVSFLKAPGYQDGHAGYSDPLDEQSFLVETINRLQQSREWNQMAIIIAYDDSDGWYDHQMSPIVSQSNVSDDNLTGPGSCGTAQPLEDGSIQNGRCGLGPRQPLLVISPYAKQNYVDHRATDRASILQFIEDNWNFGRIGGGSFDGKAGTLDGLFQFDGERAPKLILDPATGQIMDSKTE